MFIAVIYLSIFRGWCSGKFEPRAPSKVFTHTMAVQHAFYTPADFRPTASFYIFDLDGTIAISKSGRLAAHDASDTLIIPSVPQLFADLRAAGHTILIVSNQAYWSDAAKDKVEYVFRTLNVPVAVATGKSSPYRKPNPLIWHTFRDIWGTRPTEVKMIGDAVSATDPYPPYRWACSDAEFASNIGATFIRPCDIIPGGADAEPLTDGSLSVILMVGNPGSGKSTYAARLAARTGAKHIEQDRYPSRRAVLFTAGCVLRDGHSVIIDATHSNRARRNEAYAVGAKYGAIAHVIWLPRDGRPFNALRELPVPPVAYGTYTKYFSDPREDGVPVTVVH